MSKLIDMTGWRMWEHGVPDSRLTVIRRGENSKRGQANWWCQCSCGNPELKLVKASNLRNGAVLSCGCLRDEMVSKMNSRQNLIDDSSEEYAIGYTTKGEPFWFDKDLIPEVSKHCWSYDDKGYVTTLNKYTGKHMYLHRLVMGFPDTNGYVVDHKNHPPRREHKIDNRRQNLEVVTSSANSINTHLRIDNTSGEKGVGWHSQARKWVAQIGRNGKTINLGFFEEFEQAVKARKDAEKIYFKDYNQDSNINVNTIQKN